MSSGLRMNRLDSTVRASYPTILVFNFGWFRYQNNLLTRRSLQSQDSDQNRSVARRGELQFPIQLELVVSANGIAERLRLGRFAG
jgi:hypothetical protein